MNTKRVAILGSTGSIGSQTLDVISQSDGFSVCALAAGSNGKLLAEQAKQFNPQYVALSNDEAAGDIQDQLPDGTELLTGPDAMTEAVRKSSPDIVLVGVVGTSGLAPTLAAIECGARLAIANKETLVTAGAIVIPAATAAGVEILPVDSEHSAIFQCLQAGNRDEVRRIVITASGGALRDWPESRLATAGVQDALQHPTWKMGQKITIDSATLMNKALEIVEAHWLFGLPAEQIDVVIHPESIIHSYVEFRDGSVIAQMGQPDMTLPIAYALSYPKRPARPSVPLNLPKLGSLTFKPCDGRFAQAVHLGFEAIRRGSLAGTILNAANETAVEAFLAEKISFGRIVPLVAEVLKLVPIQTDEKITLDAIAQADKFAREQVAERMEDT